MNFTAAEKKILAILAAVVALFGAIVVGGAALLAHQTESDHRPYLQIAVGDELTRVYPIVWCDVLMRDCDPPLRSKATRTKSHVPVNVGQTALVSVSADIADSPWALIAEYYTPNGIVRDEPIYPSNTQFTVALRSTVERTLINIEVQAPSAIESPQGFVVRGFLAADTTPKRPTAEQ
ncbi:DUF2771 family protein [Gordonia sp. CPCC 205333]|uniref:DUF2771 family protein n=1 Tax=Gordonia sp. CPCC 205333 TaxID=3140790 RepID=UPI003AF37644